MQVSGGAHGLHVTIGSEFEEALELAMEVDAGVPAGRVKCFTVKLTIDRQPKVSRGLIAPKPPVTAVVKVIEIGADANAMIQNMPSGRDFLVAVTATLADGRRLQSRWVPARTLPMSELTGDDSQDLFGKERGACSKCPCTRFRILRRKFSQNTDPHSAQCRGCGCTALQHAKIEVPQPSCADEPAGAEPAAAAPAPQPKEGWDACASAIFVDSLGKLDPEEMAGLRRAAGSRDGATERNLMDQRVSVVCPTLESRHGFHAQLWECFNAQAWPDKELVVVETYVHRPSPFFASKREVDDRVVFLPIQVDSLANDLTIGLKRNMCAHLATGELLANFDDDDMYAPSYLTTMVEMMAEERAVAITLGSWYVFDTGCGKVGHVDPAKAAEDKTANLKNKDEWLYGYGFSYVFTREVGIAHPYENCNMGEDYRFYSKLRGNRPKKSPKHAVALFYDSYGICLHTLHAKSTSNSWAQRSLDQEELHGLEVADLGSILTSYLTRFPQTGLTSEFIAGGSEKLDRHLDVWTSQGKLLVRRPAGARVADISELLVRQCGDAAREAQFWRAIPSDPLVIDQWSLLGWRPSGPLLEGRARVGVHTDVLFAHLALDRGEAPEVSLTIRDVPDDGKVQVTVRVPHSMVRAQGVLEALVAQHGRDSDAGKKAAARVKLAISKGGTGMFEAADLSKFVAHRREFWAPGLGNLLQCDQIQ